MIPTCPHPSGTLLRIVPAGAYGGYDDEYERVPCLCPKGVERTAPDQNAPGVSSFKCPCGGTEFNLVAAVESGLKCYDGRLAYRHYRHKPEKPRPAYACCAKCCTNAWCRECYEKEFGK